MSLLYVVTLELLNLVGLLIHVDQKQIIYRHFLFTLSKLTLRKDSVKDL